MKLIDDKRVSLIVTLILTYLVLLDLAFLIFSLTARENTDTASVVASLLGWTATLFTPIAAYYLLDSWKDQKKYELNKNLIEKIIESVSSTQYLMLNNMRYANELTKIDEKLIIFKNINSITNVEGQREQHVLAYANITIFEKLTNDEEIRQAYRWYESYNMRLNDLHKQIANIYTDYYEKIEEDLLKDLGDFIIRHKDYDEGEKGKFKIEILRMESLMKIKDPIKYHGKIPIEYSLTYHELVKDIEVKTDELITLLVKQIKI